MLTIHATHSHPPGVIEMQVITFWQNISDWIPTRNMISLCFFAVMVARFGSLFLSITSHHTIATARFLFLFYICKRYQLTGFLSIDVWCGDSSNLSHKICQRHKNIIAAHNGNRERYDQEWCEVLWLLHGILF